MNKRDVANANGMKRLEAMLDVIIARDADAAAQAKERAAKRREKYGEHAVSAHARFTPVAKGSAPIRKNDTPWHRAMWRELLRLKAKGVGGYVDQLLNYGKEA